MFVECRYRIYQSCNKEIFILVDQSLLMYEMVEPYTSRFAQVACAAAIKTKNDIEKYKRGYEEEI